MRSVVKTSSADVKLIVRIQYICEMIWCFWMSYVWAYLRYFVTVSVQYSSWSGDIRTSFKAVLVDLISSTAGRKQETVKVQEKFLVKPAEDR